ncbi:hypothetical protein PR003_g2356 [Phytophthora rubi]|uniref:Uncharacterized protein n=1 Tax=Phytophthora rubi TaxID=129364 RepID=A0A6A4FYL1_9STRA|nr:hypothetical protein PR003_g2356 [Phytophthora rubi]
MCRPWLTAAAAAGSAPRCSCSRGGRAGADSAAEPSESWHGSLLWSAIAPMQTSTWRCHLRRLDSLSNPLCGCN